MNKKLYVGNLPYSITETALRELFAQAGEVTSVNIITDRDTNRPRGFAFVEMATDEAARQAILQVNGKAIEGRTLIVEALDNGNLALSARNLQQVTCVAPGGINVYNLLTHEQVAITRDAAALLDKQLGDK